MVEITTVLPPWYGKMMTIGKKLHVHDENNEAGLGDTVRVMGDSSLPRPSALCPAEIVARHN